MREDQLEELLQKYLDDNILEAEAQQLLALLKNNPEHLQASSYQVAMERLLKFHGDYHNPKWFKDEVLLRLRKNNKDQQFTEIISEKIKKQSDTSNPTRIPFWLSAAAIVLLCTSLFFFSIKPQVNVKVLSSIQSKLSHKHQLITNPKQLNAGEYNLSNGFLELQFKSDTVAILEGPTQFTLTSNDSIDLHQGKMVVRTGTDTKTFIVNTPRKKVIDRGTEFAIAVSEKQVTEVHVLDGKVDAQDTKNKKTTTLKENVAMKWDQNNKETNIHFNTSTFLRDMPPIHLDKEVTYTHWSFDEGLGAIAEDRGINLNQKFHANFKTYPKDKQGAKWVEGKYSKAIEFDGKNDYLETDYEGIGGYNARTVAFWVKVPTDWTPYNGYGIVGWGSYIEKGATWQISINPAVKEGPIGKLRCGTNQAQAIGTTDLRDGQWHHIAVVMYGGEKADVSTHVLMFIDGKLEMCSTKSIMNIDTDTKGPTSRKVMIGRNVSTYYLKTKPGSNWYFKGAVDELYIFNIALSPYQIEALMNENKFRSNQDTLAFIK